MRQSLLRSCTVSARLETNFTCSCPHCRVELEPPAGGWDGWVRCPSCARVFLPPEPDRVPHGVSAGAASSPNGGNRVGDGTTTGPALVEPAGIFTSRMAHTSGTRLVFTTGFVLCLFLSLIFFLDFQPGKLAIFGALTIGFFLLLLRTPRKRLPPVGPN
jgi:hypothetical protein